MCSVQEKQRVDRELSSELIESPVNPAFLNMIQPLIGGFDPLFYLRINAEALWEWRKLKQKSQVFDAIKFNLQKNRLHVFVLLPRQSGKRRVH